MNRKKSIGPTNYIFSWAVNERILIKWAQIWAALIFIQLSAELSVSAIFPEERERELSAKYLWATNALQSTIFERPISPSHFKLPIFKKTGRKPF